MLHPPWVWKSKILVRDEKHFNYLCIWRAHFQNVLNPLLMKIEFLTSLYRIILELVTEWNLDLDNSRKYFYF